MPDQGRARGTRDPDCASGQMGHGGEEGGWNHGGSVGSTGRGGVRASEAGVEGNSDHATLEEGSPAKLTPHLSWAEDEQRGCQMTAVEEAGVGGSAAIFRGAGTGGHFRGAGTGGLVASSGAGQGNQRRRRAGQGNQQGRRREKRGQFNLQISLPVDQIPLHV